MIRKRFGALFVLLLVSAAFGCAAAAQEITVSEGPTVPEETTTPAEPPAGPPPNVVLVLADDLDDALLRTRLGAYPHIRRLYREGTSFRNSFVTNSVCCPSRSTGLTGRYSHNHGVMDNTPPDGGAPRFRSEEAEALPVWLQRSPAGYATGHIGKYMNAYDGSYVPPGWDEWAGYVPPDSELAVASGGDPLPQASPIDLQRYPDDRFAEEAASFIGRRAGSPYFLQVSLHAPHESAEGQPEYADRHAGLFPRFRPGLVESPLQGIPQLRQLVGDALDLPACFHGSPVLEVAQEVVPPHPHVLPVPHCAAPAGEVELGMRVLVGHPNVEVGHLLLGQMLLRDAGVAGAGRRCV